MNSFFIAIIVGLVLVSVFFVYFVVLYLKKKIYFQKSLNLVFFEVKIPKSESKEEREMETEQYERRDFKEMSCSVMSDFFTSLHST
jgi:predicted membrane protein